MADRSSKHAVVEAVEAACDHVLQHYAELEKIAGGIASPNPDEDECALADEDDLLIARAIVAGYMMERVTTIYGLRAE